MTTEAKERAAEPQGSAVDQEMLNQLDEIDAFGVNDNEPDSLDTGSAEPETEAKPVEAAGNEAPATVKEEPAATVLPPDYEERMKKLETELANKTNALHEERMKRKEAQELAVKLGQQPKEKPVFDGSDEYDNQVDKEVSDTIDKVVSPKLVAMQRDIRATNYLLSEQRAKGKYGNYAEVTKDFDKIVDERPDIRHAFFSSEDPAEFAYRTTIAMNFESILDTERKKAKEDAAKEFEARIKTRKTIPSLSLMGGVPLKDPGDESELRKQLDDI